MTVHNPEIRMACLIRRFTLKFISFQSQLSMYKFECFKVKPKTLTYWWSVVLCSRGKSLGMETKSHLYKMANRIDTRS